jgi:hypothetical protein
VSDTPGAVTFDDGSRYYPIDGEQFWSVTTALKVLSSEGLIWWAAGLAADAAFQELPKLAAAMLVKDCGNTFNRCKQGKGDRGHDWRLTCETCPCQQCRPCMREWMRRRHTQMRDDRADEGRRVHEWAKEWIRGNQLPIHNDIAPYIRAFLAFVSGYGLTPQSWLFSEAVVVNREHRYAGTTDGAVRFFGTTDLARDLIARVLGIPVDRVSEVSYVDAIIDLKTKSPLKEGDSPRFWPEVALQMTAYRCAPTLLLRETDQEVHMPPLQGAMALHLYPDMAVPRLCVSDEGTFGAFVNALNLYRWTVELGAKSVAEASFPLVKPEPVASVKAPGTRAAPRKTAAKKAAPPPPIVDVPLPETVPAVRQPASATVASILRTTPEVHPNSPYRDSIPF